MNIPKKEIIKFNNKEIELYFFNNPMSHEDWHTVEKMGLIYLYYAYHGPDYWNNKFVFCKKEDYELAEKWYALV